MAGSDIPGGNLTSAPKPRSDKTRKPSLRSRCRFCMRLKLPTVQPRDHWIA